MVIETIKFSEMTDAGNINNNDKTPGLEGGANVLFNNAWTFLPPGTTAERPTPSSIVNFRLRFNTTEQLYEYYDAVLGQWTQLQESAFTVGPFVTYTADASLPGAQNLGLLADGILRQTISAGVATLDILQIPLTGAYGGTGVNNGTLTINLGAAVENYVLTSDALGNATWQSVASSGVITSIDGDTGSAVPVAGVVIISGSTTGLTFTGSGNTLDLGGILISTNGGTGVADPTIHGIMVAQGASPMTPIVLGAGQVLIGTTASDPVAGAIGSGTGILVANASGSISVGLAPIATLTGLVNTTGGSAAPIATTLTAWIDAALGATQGNVLYRNASDWVVLAPGTSGQFLQTLGAAANVQWASGNSGTVTSVATNNGLTGGTITTTGTLGLAAIADHTLLANISGGSLFPSSTTLTALIDNAIGNTQGNILYRNASAWVVLAPGTAGFSLQTGGAGADPAYSNTFTNSTLVTPATLGAQQQALNMNSHLINNVTDPVSAQDAATKNYVDQTALSGTSVYAATNGSLGTVTQSGSGVGATLTNAGAQATLSVDGVNPPVGADVLVKDTATGMTAANEGIYTVTSVGSGASNWSMVRKTGYDTAPEINNTGLIIVQNGTLAGTAWYNTTTIVTVDTTNFNYAQFGQTLANVNPNMIYGGNFDTNPWQRGVSFAGVTASGTYMADRWRSASNGAGLYTATQASDAPTVAESGIFTRTCFQVDVTTADASIGAADFYGLRYAMEGFDFAQLAQRPFTLSFWVKSTITGLYSVAFQNSVADQSYIGTYTVNVSDTWEFKTITVPASPAGGTWNYTNGIGCQLYFMMAAGSNYFGTSGAWTASAIYADASQANAFSSTSNFFKLSLVKMEAGSAATAWELRSEEEEWALCQRYYEKSYNPLNYPGAFGVTGVIGPRWGAVSPGAVPYGISVTYKVRKCGTGPTVVIYSAGDGSAGNVFVQLIGNSAATVDNSMSTAFNVSTTAGSYDMEFYWASDSEL